jgi:hypothetical protein
MSEERTEQAIKEQIDWLAANQKKIQRYSKFEEDNWAKIDAQLEVLRETLDEDEIFERQDRGEWDEGQVMAAQSAQAWRDGEEDTPPSDDWAGLVEK